MLQKVAVLLFAIGAVLGHRIQVTPEDLKEFFQNVDNQVKALEHETMIQLRENVIPLQIYSDNAKAAVIDNITSTAQPYWAEIKSLEDNATQQGQNISDCINLGNNQLYALNNTIANKALATITFYHDLGNQTLYASSTEAYTVIQELLALEVVVAACNDDTCATDLMPIVTQYFARAKSTLIDAETKARNFVLTYLPIIFAANSLDVDAYVANYTVFLNNVTDCISNL